MEGGHRDDGAGRAPVAEKLRIDGVEGVPMVDADEEGGDVEDAAPAGAGGGQHAVEIGEGQADLLLEPAVGGVGAVGQARQLARAEDQAGVGERRDVMRVGRRGAVDFDGGGQIYILSLLLTRLRSTGARSRIDDKSQHQTPNQATTLGPVCPNSPKRLG